MADGTVFNIRPYLVLRSFFGYYHNIIPNSGNRARYLHKTVSVIIFILICFVSMLCKVSSYGIVWLIACAIQYIINIMCSLYTEDEYILEYFRYEPLIDDKRSKKSYTKLNIILMGYVILVMTCHLMFYGLNGIILTVQGKNPCEEPWQYPLVGSMRLAMHLGRIPVLAVFGLFYCRVHIFCKKVRQQMLKNTDTFNSKKYLLIYEHIRTTLHQTDFPIKLLIFTHLTMVFLDISNILYKMITLFSISTLLISIFQLLSNLIIFFPCLIMEMISEDVEKMRIIVADKMISCANEDQRDECRYFLQCVRQRPMIYVIWRAFKMDFSLLLSYLSLFITYLVCILQFKPGFINPSITANFTAQ